MAALAVAVAGQGAYYGVVQVTVGLGLAAAALASLRVAPWSKDDVRGAPVPACAALVGWTVASAAVNGSVGAAGGYVALLGGVGAVAIICRRLRSTQRAALADAIIALAALTAVTGWVGVAWRVEPWVFQDAGVWRAATVLTYHNAAAGLLAPVGLLALGRLVFWPNSALANLAACLVLAGAAATLSRGGALAFAAGAAVLVGLVGLRRFLAAAGPPAVGAAVTVAGLAPSMPADTQPRPALAALALLIGLAAAVGLPRMRTRTLAAVAVAVTSAGVLAVAVGGSGDGVPNPIRESRLSIASRDRAEEAAAALRLVGDRPLTGVGPGRAILVWETPGGETLFSRYAHNEYLQVLAELGAVGFLLLVALIGTVAVAAWRGRAWAASDEVWAGAIAALVAFAVHAGFDFLWHIPAIPLAAAAVVGITARGTDTHVRVGG